MIFNVQELPAGRSERQIALTEDDLELNNEVRFLGGDLNVSFQKTNHFIEVRFDVSATVEMICDRSFNTFQKVLKGRYQLLYKPGINKHSDSENGGVRTLDVHRSVIDIADEVRDTVLLEVPIRKIHPDFEADPVSDFTVQNENPEEANDHQSRLDPRWSALNKLKQN